MNSIKIIGNKTGKKIKEIIRPEVKPNQKSLTEIHTCVTVVAPSRPTSLPGTICRYYNPSPRTFKQCVPSKKNK